MWEIVRIFVLLKRNTMNITTQYTVEIWTTSSDKKPLVKSKVMFSLNERTLENEVKRMYGRCAYPVILGEKQVDTLANKTNK